MGPSAAIASVVMLRREAVQVGFGIAVVALATLACKARSGASDAGTTVTTAAATTTSEPTASAAPSASAPAEEKSVYAVGDKVDVIWQGSPYKCTVLAVLPNDKYKIHYVGWGSNWDEVVGLDRIVGAKGAPKPAAKPTATAGAGGGGGGGADAPCPGPGLTRRCNGKCVNIQTDDNNCGSCGTVCSGGKHCDGHMFCRDSEGNL